MEDKKEDKDDFSYESLWNKVEAKKEKELLKELPKGIPRKGIKGKWIKIKIHVTKNQIKGSYESFIREIKKKQFLE